MSIEKLQQNIRRGKTPVALGLSAQAEKLPEALLRQFVNLYGEGPMATAKALRFHGCRVIETAAERLGAVYLRVSGYLRHGSMGLDVVQNLCSAARSRGLYVIADCRGSEAESWFAVLPDADAVTVSPYAGGESCRCGEEQAVFALVRTAGALSGEVQNLMSGDRRLYLAVADQMARRGCGAVVETGYSLDIRELRKRQEKLFLVLTGCTPDDAVYAFDDYGHGALVVDDTIQYANDTAEAVQKAVKAMKQVVTVL